MTSDREGHFLWLSEALTRFKATGAEVRAHCESGKIAAVYVTEEGRNGIRVCVEDMRKWFEELGDPEETTKKSTFGKVLRGTATAAGGAVVVKLVEEAWPSVEQAWSFLAQHIFRSLPEPKPQPVYEGGTPPPAPPYTTDRSMQPARDYITREGAGGGASSPNPSGGSGVGPSPSSGPGGRSPGGGHITRDGGSGGGWTMR